MLTKQFESKELLPFGQLRSLNQKDLLKFLQDNEKIGVVIKDQLEVTMLSMEKYEKLLDAIREYQRLLEWHEEKLLYEERIINNQWVEKPEGMSLVEWIGAK